MIPHLTEILVLAYLHISETPWKRVWYGNFGPISITRHTCNHIITGLPVPMSCLKHLKLVLCAWYFLDAWTTFLENAGYKHSQYFLSWEAIDIAQIIIEGYIALLVIHCDHVHAIFPLLPWLHSMEACKHAFGEA